MLAQAVEAEAAAWIADHAHLKDESGRKQRDIPKSRKLQRDIPRSSSGTFLNLGVICEKLQRDIPKSRRDLRRLGNLLVRPNRRWMASLATATARRSLSVRPGRSVGRLRHGPRRADPARGAFRLAAGRDPTGATLPHVGGSAGSGGGRSRRSDAAPPVPGTRRPSAGRPGAPFVRPTDGIRGIAVTANARFGVLHGSASATRGRDLIPRER
jgi:hypothetical protein